MKKRRMVHPVVTGLATVLVAVAGRTWTDYEFALWAVFLLAALTYLYVKLREPVNYDSLVISEDAIEYAAMGRLHVIRFRDIDRVQVAREKALFYSGIESMWVIKTIDGERVELMNEWPHRRRLIGAFTERLPGFDLATALTGLRARKEGVWVCFEGPNARSATSRLTSAST